MVYSTEESIYLHHKEICKLCNFKKERKIDIGVISTEGGMEKTC